MRRKNLFKTMFLAGFCLASLGGCEWLKDSPAGGETAVREPIPQVKLMQTADSTWIAPESPTPPQEHLVPADEPAQNALKRLEKLEEQVQSLHNDMSAIMPALTKIAQAQAAAVAQEQQGAATPESFPGETLSPKKAAVSDIQPQAGVESSPSSESFDLASPQPLISDQSKPEEGAGSAPVAAGYLSRDPSVPHVLHVRVGEHPDKTRIVLDTSDDVSFSHNLDNGQHVLTLRLPDTGWQGPVQGTSSPDAPLVETWRAEADGKGGTVMTISLRRDAQVLWAQPLQATDSKGTPRIVVDLAGL